MSTHRPEKVRTWRVLVEAWKQSGKTVNAFCRARQITVTDSRNRQLRNTYREVTGLFRPLLWDMLTGASNLQGTDQ